MKKIILTCDTEVVELSRDLEDGFDIFIKGKINGREVGVNYINSLASQYGATVNHFVDVYNPNFSLEIANMCEDILSNGHKIYLHTHPLSRYGMRYLNQFSLSKQEEIINWGQNYFCKNFGFSPIAHRAGSYAADDNTFTALRKAGIMIDCSYYPGEKCCKITSIRNINSVEISNSVLEIPVTVYGIRKQIFKLFSWKIHYQKLDFRYGSNVGEILETIDNTPDNSVFILFMHSFNFINRKYSYKKKRYLELSINENLIYEYVRLLQEINKRDNCCWEDIDNIKKEHDGYTYIKNKCINFQETINNRFAKRDVVFL